MDAKVVNCKNIKNTLILNHDSIVEKQELVKMILKYNAPDKVKLMLFDSNKLCFENLNGIPNLLCPVITDYNKMSVGLKNIACEMERRYDLFVENKVKNILTFTLAWIPTTPVWYAISISSRSVNTLPSPFSA